MHVSTLLLVGDIDLRHTTIWQLKPFQLQPEGADLNFITVLTTLFATRPPSSSSAGTQHFALQQLLAVLCTA